MYLDFYFTESNQLKLEISLEKNEVKKIQKIFYIFYFLKANFLLKYLSFDLINIIEYKLHFKKSISFKIYLEKESFTN